MSISNIAILLTSFVFLGMIIYVALTIDKDPKEKKHSQNFK